MKLNELFIPGTFVGMYYGDICSECNIVITDNDVMVDTGYHLKSDAGKIISLSDYETEYTFSDSTITIDCYLGYKYFVIEFEFEPCCELSENGKKIYKKSDLDRVQKECYNSITDERKEEMPMIHYKMKFNMIDELYDFVAKASKCEYDVTCKRGQVQVDAASLLGVLGFNPNKEFDCYANPRTRDEEIAFESDFKKFCI